MIQLAAIDCDVIAMTIGVVKTRFFQCSEHHNHESLQMAENFFIHMGQKLAAVVMRLHVKLDQAGAMVVLQLHTLRCQKHC